MTLTIGSLFAGIGGFDLGFEWAGLGPVKWQVEIDPFCREVLARHWPNVERYDDVAKVGRANLAPVDIVCGGFPCQDTSSAGRGAGLTGHRSGLWREFRRIVEELRPRFVAVENPASGKSRWLCEVRSDLHALGYRTRALGIGAVDVGAPHRRARVFVVAHPDGLDVRNELERQPGGRPERLRGSGEAVARDDGEDGALAHAARLRRGGGWPTREQAHGEGWDASEGRRAPLRPWTVEPGVGRVAHGLPERLERLAALGNAAVPQCAEIVGRVIRGMA